MKEFDNALTAVENRFHEAILPSMDNLVIPRVETAVRSITGSSGRGPNSVAHNHDQRDFSGNMENHYSI